MPLTRWKFVFLRLIIVQILNKYKEMTLETIEISNFRCFTNYTINLAPKVSVLIGRNGAGKTSLLRAIRYALGFVFSTEKKLGDELLVAGNEDVKMEQISGNDFFSTTFNGIPATSTSIHTIAKYLGETLDWTLSRRNVVGEDADVSKYMGAYHRFMKAFKDNDTLPVYAYFSDSFPHKEGGLTEFAKTQLGSYDKTLRTFGYDQWDKEPSYSYMWLIRWLNAIIRDVQTNHADAYSHEEANYITLKLMQASVPVNKDCDDSFQITTPLFNIKDDKSMELWLRMKSGNDILFQNLPAGYLRLYSIVLDICCRHWILNHDSKKEPVGVVIIDEVDLHLHPTLAVEVVERLTRTFPKIQFILSTHSPLVVSNIKTNTTENKIFRMVYGENKPHEVADIYGLDYNIALQTVMDGSASNGVTDYLRSSILRNMRQGRNDLVEQKKSELKALVSEVRFQAIMENIEKSFKENR